MQNKPLHACVAGWVLLPSMYLLLGALAANDVTVITAFAVALPLGVLGLLCWVLALMVGTNNLINRRNIRVSIVAIIGALIPFALLGMAFMIASNGGV